jgi:hypothetical protein
LKLNKYSVGVGDRFAHQAKAQLQACIEALQQGGVEVIPVWNKSNREHQHYRLRAIVSDTRRQPTAPVKTLGIGRFPTSATPTTSTCTTVDRFLSVLRFLHAST